MPDGDRFYMPTLKVEWDAGPVKFISNTSYYDRKERVNGYSGTLYNLRISSIFAQPANLWVIPRDPERKCLCPQQSNCGSLVPLC